MSTDFIVPQAWGRHLALHLYHRYYTKCHLNVPFPFWGRSASAQPGLMI